MRLKKKIISIIMLVILLSGNLLNVGSQVIALSSTLPVQNSKTNSSNVEFNSYLEGGDHEKTLDTSTGGNLYIKVNVKESGYLRNGIVELENQNFEVDSSQIESNYIQKIENEKIYLEQIKSGEEVLISLPITFKKDVQIDNDYFSKDTRIYFSGNYINGNGDEKKVEKTITNRIKWQANPEIEIEGEVSKYIPYHKDNEYGVMVQSKITTGIKENKLPIAKTKLQIEVPEIKLPNTDEEAQNQLSEEMLVGEPTEEFESKKPERISVISNSLKATKGNSSENIFGKENYTYNKEEGKIVIEVSNSVAEGKIAWGEGKDEYIVTFIYEGKEVYDYIQEQIKEAKAGKLSEEEIKQGKTNEQAITGEIKVGVELETYNPEEATIGIEGVINYSIEEEKGNITEFNAIANEKLSKAYMYANYSKKENKQETEYNVIYKTDIYDTKLNKNIEYEIKNDKIEYQNEKYLSGNNTYIKQIRISEENFKKILGEEGKIEVTKNDGTVIAIIKSEQINSQQVNNEQDELEEETENVKTSYLDNQTKDYVLDIVEEKASELKIKTSDLISEGTMKLEITKAFKGNAEYTKEQMKQITKIETEAIARTDTNEKVLSKEIQLEELTNKAEISIAPESLSTVVVNKNVEIRAILDTSNINNALYKNPTLKIKFPSYVDNIKINNKDILMSNGLKIKNANVEVENGQSVINVTLEGEQTDYTLDAEYIGTIILLDTDITVKTLTPSNENKIEMIYINGNDVVKEKQGKVETKVSFVAPTGVVSANAIANYAENSKEVMSISDKTEEIQIETYSDKKVATVTGTVVNNYGNKITDLKILGRLPSKDNRKIDSEEEIGSTFDAVINSEIKVTGLENYKVYYSNKVDANSNLEDAENGWTEKFSKEAKSYMILADEGYEMNEQEVITFSYDIEVPANLSYNNSSYEMYKVYYTNTSEVGSLEETKESPVIALTTGEGPELDVKLESTADVIREGQTVRMEVTVTNTGDMAVTNAKLNIPKPEEAKLLDYEIPYAFNEESLENKEIELGTIKPKEEVKITYYLRIDPQVKRIEIYEAENGKKYIRNEDGILEEFDGEVPEPEFTTQVTVKVDEIEKAIPSNEYKNVIKEGTMSLELIGCGQESVPFLVGRELEFKLFISKIDADADLSNVVVTIPLLDNITYKEAYIITNDNQDGIRDGITYDKGTHSLKVNISNLNFDKQIIHIKAIAKDFKGLTSTMAVAQVEGGEEHYSNLIRYEAQSAKVRVSELKATPKYVKEREKITYEFDLINEGLSSVGNISIVDKLPDDLMFVEASYTFNNGKNTSKISKATDNTVKIDINTLQAGETMTIKIIAKAKALANKNDKQIRNSAEISSIYFDTIKTNTVTNTIEYNEEIHQKPGTGGTTTETRYKITGTAWLDENKDGKRDETEKVLDNIPVILLNKFNNTIVTDVDTQLQKRVTTSNNGTYEFGNLLQGEYLVIFLYDASSYSLTTYKAQGVDEGLNSDAIDINVAFEGEKKIAGITDVIKITNANIRDIDIGLYASEKFDLRLDKYISKITLTTPTIGTRVTTYDNTQLAKVEVLAKNVNKSNIIVEYKIKVTNEGKIAGYAKKLVDYLPEDAMFMSEVNNDWYLSNNRRDVYNTSLENTIINPGESKEVTLVLSFNITDKNIGNIVNNNAEIYESYNEEGKEDLDSIAGNNNSQEDDISKADIILSVVTGKLVVGSILIVVILAILIFGIYEIKKQVLKNKIN